MMSYREVRNMVTRYSIRLCSSPLSLYTVTTYQTGIIIILLFKSADFLLLLTLICLKCSNVYFPFSLRLLYLVQCDLVVSFFSYGSKILPQSSARFSLILSVYLCLSVFLCLSVCLSVCLSLSLSLCLLLSLNFFHFYRHFPLPSLHSIIHSPLGVDIKLN